MNISHIIESKALQQQVILGAAAFLIVLLAGTVIYTVWQWHDDWQLAHKPYTLSPPINNNETTNLIANIPNYHLFGQAASGDVPISNLQLQVTGIVKVTDTDHSTSKAYISISGQPSKIYRVDERLPDGVKINDITSDAVILDNGGHLEKLPLPRAKLQFKPRDAVETE